MIIAPSALIQVLKLLPTWPGGTPPWATAQYLGDDMLAAGPCHVQIACGLESV